MVDQNNTALIGMAEIAKHVRRSESTVLQLIRNMDFPARKIGGIWESDTEKIKEWRREMIDSRSFSMSSRNTTKDQHPSQ